MKEKTRQKDHVPSQNVGLSAGPAVRMTSDIWILIIWPLFTVDFDNVTHSRSPTGICYHTIVATQMSAGGQSANPSISNFTAIFEAASHEYKTLTKQDLATHPFAAELQGYNSPDSILNVFRDQAQAFDKFRKTDDRLMEWLTPIVNILFTFSESLGEGIGLVSPLRFYMSRCYTIASTGIFACKDDFHRNRCPSRGAPPPISTLVYAYMMLGLGGERCYGKL